MRTTARRGVHGAVVQCVRMPNISCWLVHRIQRACYVVTMDPCASVVLSNRRRCFCLRFFSVARESYTFCFDPLRSSFSGGIFQRSKKRKIVKGLGEQRNALWIEAHSLESLRLSWRKFANLRDR